VVLHGPPIEAAVPEDWISGVDTEQEDGHRTAALLAWVAEAEA
jgi:hypothetical protein